MVDRGKEADFRMRDPRTGSASNGPSTGIEETVAAAGPESGETGRTAARGNLNDHTRNRIAAQLRAMYDTIAQQPVPDRFAELIAKLDGSDTGKL
jgi:hypothetical protein